MCKAKIKKLIRSGSGTFGDKHVQDVHMTQSSITVMDTPNLDPFKDESIILGQKSITPDRIEIYELEKSAVNYLKNQSQTQIE